MVSNALSARRGPLRRPKVCFSSPNPGRCHPPPPPPSWPPGAMPFGFTYTYDWFMGPQTESWGASIPRFMTDWMWTLLHIEPDNAEVVWSVTESTATADLDITGTSTDFGVYEARKSGIGVTLGVQTAYDIDTWDVLTPGLSGVHATFLF